MNRTRFVLALAVLLMVAACDESPTHRVVQQASGVDALLIGLDVVSAQVVWAAGTAGTFAWTDDGGVTWHTGVVPGADTLQFRDVEALDADAAILLSIGPGAHSRIYRTADRGSTWELVFENALDAAFYDCMDFWDDGAGLAFSDGVDGRFPIAETRDGSVWGLLPPDAQPAAAEGEGGFAASGTCLVTLGDSTAFVATGNGPTARVLRTDDRGRSWTTADIPMEAGDAAGLASLSFFDAQHGMAFGGNLASGDSVQTNAFATDDGGAAWRVVPSPAFPGAVYGSTVIPGTDGVIAVGPGGAAYSDDRGSSWVPLDTLAYWSVDAAGMNAVWMVGPDGRMARIELE